MKKTTSVIIALLSLQATGADIRDATFQATTNAAKVTYNQGQRAIESTYKVADITADKLKAFFSKSSEFTVDLSGDIAEAIVKLAKIFPPAFEVTADGIALVFEVSGKATQSSLDVSRKLVILLEPTTDATHNVLERLVDLSMQGSTEATQLSEKILKKLAEILERPVEISTEVSDKLAELLIEMIEASSKGTMDTTRLLDKLVNRLADILEEPLKVSSNATLDSIDVTSEALEKLLEVSSESSEASAKLVSDIIRKILPLLEKAAELSSDATVDTSRLISEIVEAILEALDKPIKVTLKATDYSERILTNVSRALDKVLEKSLEISVETSTESSRIISKIVDKILEVLEKPMDLSTEGTNLTIRTLDKLLVELADAISKSSEISSDVIVKLLKLMDHVSENSIELSTNVIGKDNIEAAGDISAGATKLSLDASEAIFYFITKNVTALSKIFDSNRMEREQVAQIYERNDEVGKAGVRDLIRAEIKDAVENGEVLDQLLSDEFIDTYVKVRLAVGEE